MADINLLRPAYVINLPGRPDRKAQATEQFAKVGIEPTFVEAVEGKDILPDRLDYFIKHCQHINTESRARAALGCTESHLSVLEMAWASGAETVAVFEDDVLFAPNFRYRWEKAVLPEKWDLLMLGGRPRGATNPEPGTAVHRILNAHHTHAYIASREAMAQLISLWSKHYQLSSTDHVWFQVQERIMTYLFLPCLAMQRPSYSDIEEKHRKYDRLWMFADFEPEDVI